jgi:hypothetical protein
LQSNLDDDLPHRLKDVSRLQPDLPVYCLRERRVCRNIDEFSDNTDRQLNVLTTQNERLSVRQQTGNSIRRKDQYLSLPRGHVNVVRCTQNCMEIHVNDAVGTGPDNVVLLTKDHDIERCIRESAVHLSLLSPTILDEISILNVNKL